MGNKIKYGLKNVHYSVITNTEGVINYATPVAIPGAVNLVLNAKGDKTEFYADDGAYFVATLNQGYDGNLEVALIPDVFKKDVLGEIEDANGALFEDSEAKIKAIALMYEFKGDSKKTKHVNYNVSVARPSVQSNTRTNSITPETDTLAITASPAEDTGYVKGKIEEGQTGYDDFYSAVYLEDAVQNTVASDTVSFAKDAPVDIAIDVTSTSITNAVRNVKIDGIDVAGVNLTVTGVDVSIDSDYIGGLDNGEHIILVEFDKGNAVTVTLTVAATA